jgi:hypothetical protein
MVVLKYLNGIRYLRGALPIYTHAEYDECSLYGILCPIFAGIEVIV